MWPEIKKKLLILLLFVEILDFNYLVNYLPNFYFQIYFVLRIFICAYSFHSLKNGCEALHTIPIAKFQGSDMLPCSGYPESLSIDDLILSS